MRLASQLQDTQETGPKKSPGPYPRKKRKEELSVSSGPDTYGKCPEHTTPRMELSWDGCWGASYGLIVIVGPSLVGGRSYHFLGLGRGFKNNY